MRTMTWFIEDCEGDRTRRVTPLLHNQRGLHEEPSCPKRRPRLKVVAIASNDTTEFPEDGPEGMKQTIWRAAAYQC